MFNGLVSTVGDVYSGGSTGTKHSFCAAESSLGVVSRPTDGGGMRLNDAGRKVPSAGGRETRLEQKSEAERPSGSSTGDEEGEEVNTSSAEGMRKES